jgi:hypothetical protein
MKRLEKPGYRERVNRQGKLRNDTVKEYLRDIKSKSGCVDCGYNKHHSALEFHHIGDKDINLAFAKSIRQANEEISKCVILCSNCHRIRHWNQHHPEDPCKAEIFEATYEPVEET